MSKKILPKWDWKNEEVKNRLRQSLESVGLTPVPDEPAWQQVAHEVHRLGPTEERPTADYARRAGINSIPPWQVPAEPGTFHQEEFEFRDGRPRLVDSAEVSLRPDTPEKFVPRTVLECTAIDFEYDDLPEWAAEDYRVRLLTVFAKLLCDIDSFMRETYGPDYLSRVDLAGDSFILKSIFEAYRGMDLTSPHAVAMDLLVIGTEGLPHAGSELQRMQPNARLPDCGITALVSLTEEIQRQLADAPVGTTRSSSSSERPKIVYDLDGKTPQLTCNGRRYPLTPRGNLLLRQLLKNGARSPEVVSYDELLAKWPPARAKATTKRCKVPTDPLNKLHAFRGTFNEKVTEALKIDCEAIVKADGVGFAVNAVNLIWKRHGSWVRRKEAAAIRTAMAAGGKAAGVDEQPDYPTVARLATLDPDQFAATVAVMDRAGNEHMDKEYGPYKPHSRDEGPKRLS